MVCLIVSKFQFSSQLFSSRTRESEKLPVASLNRTMSGVQILLYKDLNLPISTKLKILPRRKLHAGQTIVLLRVPAEVVIVPAEVEPEKGGQGALLLIHIDHFSQTSLWKIVIEINRIGLSTHGTFIRILCTSELLTMGITRGL